MARLEAEIDSLTEASIAVNTRSDTAAPEEPAPPTATKGSEAQARRRDTAAIPAPKSEQRPDVGTEGAGDDEDDAEIVIVNCGVQGGGARGTRHAVRPPGPSASSAIHRRPRTTTRKSKSCDPATRRTQKNADGREARTPVKPESGRERTGATKPTAPAKWRLFRGSR